VRHRDVLRRGVVRERQPELRVDELHEAGAVEPGLGIAPAPEIPDTEIVLGDGDGDSVPTDGIGGGGVQRSGKPDRVGCIKSVTLRSCIRG
jgi:hypothetical protein